MKYSEMIIADGVDIDEKKAARRVELAKALSEELTSSASEFGANIEVLCINEKEDHAMVRFRFSIEGFAQDDAYYWGWDVDVQDAAKAICKNIAYIRDLRDKYPEHASRNDYIQEHRMFTKSFELLDRKYPTICTFSVPLCGYLKLPNTTECSVGGGDYEIKQTPQRVMDFKENIDRTIDALIDCIAELRTLKNGIPKRPACLNAEKVEG